MSCHLSIWGSTILLGVGQSDTASICSLPGLTAGSAPTLSPLRSVTFAPTAPTPRPALTPSSPQNHTSKQCHSMTPERSPSPGHCDAGLPPLQHGSKNKEQSQSGADSSGYSSAEGPYRKPSPATSTTRTPPGSSGAAPSPGYRSRINDAFSNLMSENYFVFYMCVCVSGEQ